jgi:hypothetical protein
MSQYVRAATRYWWLILAGTAAAALLMTLLVYRVESISPLKLVTRDKISYAASTQLLVDSASGPYLRTIQRPTETVFGAPSENSKQPTGRGATVQTGALVQAANLFPSFIMSDNVARRRQKLIGTVSGAVVAKGLFSFAGNNRYRPSPLPIVQIQAFAPTKRNALKLIAGTVRAFTLWLVDQQSGSKIPREDRIVVRQLSAPRGAIPVGGTSLSLPLLGGAGLFFAFLALAIVLDRARPRHRGSASAAFEGGPVELEGSVAALHRTAVADRG